MGFWCQLIGASLVGVAVYYALNALNNRRRMKGAKPPPGAKGEYLVTALISNYSFFGIAS
jgi:hypothetical protein